MDNRKLQAISIHLIWILALRKISIDDYAKNDRFVIVVKKAKKNVSQLSPTQIKKPAKRNIVYNYILPLAELLFILFVIRIFILEAYHVPTGSMIDTILPGDFLLIEKVTYRFKPPVAGDIVVFNFPLDPKFKYVKRCVAVGGDTVEFRNKMLYVNGEVSEFQGAQHVDPHIFSKSNRRPSLSPKDYQRYWLDRKLMTYDPSVIRDNFGPVVLPDDMIFAAGDNRDQSSDSRFWGPVPLDMVTGRPTFVYLSTDIIEDVSQEDRRNFTMIDNIFLIFKAIFQFWRIRFDRFFLIIR